VMVRGKNQRKVMLAAVMKEEYSEMPFSPYTIVHIHPDPLHLVEAFYP
jgi:hypothetical protein